MSERFNDAFQYGLTEGYPPLRQAVSEICHFPVASPVQPPRSISLRLAAIAWISLPVRCSIRAILSSLSVPPILAALQVFQLAQANILSVDTDDDGMLVEQLADLLETTRVKAVYLVPTFGNPGGKTLRRGASSPVG